MIIMRRSVMNYTWSSLTCDGKLPQRRGRFSSIVPGLVNPPVRSLPEQNPAMERPGNSKYNSLLSLYVFRSTSPLHLSRLPFQDQVEPVSEDSHPDESEPRVPPKVEPDWEEAEECGVQVSHCGRQAKQALITAVFGLQMGRQLNPPTV